MIEQIQLLGKLQKLDLEIIEAEKRLAELPLKKAKFEQHLRELEEEQRISEETRAREMSDKERREAEIEQEEHKIKNVETRMTHIRNEKDYKEIKKKLELAKKANKLREEEVIRLMESLEKSASEEAARVNALEEERSRVEEGRKIYDNEETDIGIRKTELLMKRQEIAGKLDKDILDRYEFLRENSHGVGVSIARHEACEGCYMSLPPQLYNMVIKGDKLYNCPFCQRFLIHEPDDEAVAEKDPAEQK